ncbi:dicarboxylate/amino acid:cation symporter [Brachyspira pilosicoli]|nr:dicarboxylate/amino acid:cation symporter [Brachyspira pilosicoli]AFR70298.1 Na+/H+ dicarboxylate symporter [Brachyspira pilosicoli B2904]AGA65525.1 H(+):sodium-dicarboxylate symporter [Brachyspira pilosicoli P43/6/78]MBW5382584.1 dicarboxylate/amino acid:cation symporter [Brachyspira pilosicoli]MBW5391841.1 dicarboxylate/amino acid:cation symporter [Brachyspira pilosicoli]MBW5399145.1 dicarboxylate/amino acid:cation symporter [Brachyspira pilosicoli]
MNILKNYKFSFILILGMLVGSIIGVIFGEKATVLQPIADIFLNLLYCCVVPMIFVSLVYSISNMENTNKLGKVLGIMIVIFLLAETIAAIYMLIITIIFNPAEGANIAMNETINNMTSNSNILAMFTVNDFPLLWSRQNLMALIVFAMLIGIATVKVGEVGKPVVKFFGSLTSIISKVVSYVMYIAPIGLGAFFATLVGQNGAALSGPLSRALIIYFIAAVVFYFLSNTVFAYLAYGIKGVKLFWKYIIPPSLVSLGTCSSAATIPTNLIAGKNIGIPDDINDLTIPMGCNLHKSGATLITILKITFMCSMFNINILEPQNIITAILVSVLASSVMGAIPAGGYVGEIFIISAFNFPPESIPIMVLIGTITDAPATAINATNDVGAGMLLARIFKGKNWIKDN